MEQSAFQRLLKIQQQGDNIGFFSYNGVHGYPVARPMVVHFLVAQQTIVVYTLLGTNKLEALAKDARCTVYFGKLMGYQGSVFGKAKIYRNDGTRYDLFDAIWTGDIEWFTGKDDPKRVVIEIEGDFAEINETMETVILPLK